MSTHPDYVPGYAFTSNEKEEMKARSERYNEIQHLRDEVIKGSSVLYGRNEYHGDIGEHKLSRKDVALLCDRGNTCFGGSVSFNGTRFKCTIWTD